MVNAPLNVNTSGRSMSTVLTQLPKVCTFIRSVDHNVTNVNTKEPQVRLLLEKFKSLCFATNEQLLLRGLIAFFVQFYSPINNQLHWTALLHLLHFLKRGSCELESELGESGDVRPNMTSYQLILLALLPFALGASLTEDGESLENVDFLLQDLEVAEFIEHLDQEENGDVVLADKGSVKFPSLRTSEDKDVSKLTKEAAIPDDEQSIGKSAELQRLDGSQSDIIGRNNSCPSRAAPKCDPKKPFRSVDGSCNNLRQPLIGSAFSAYARLRGASADYADGVSKPRAAKDGGGLPNARLVSFTLFTDKNEPSPRQTQMSVVFGQFLANDITHGLQPNLDCRAKCDGLEGECFGVKVPLNDPYFPRKIFPCFPMVRGVPACGLGTRQQVSDVTAFIDGSAIYGSTLALRSQQRNLKSVVGLLKERPNPNGNLFFPLPLAADKSKLCLSPDPVKKPCFLGADSEINENPGLMVFHTLWLLESNRLTRQLKTVNNGWSATRISQETRKIVGAMIQHITFNEYLPQILDRKTLATYGLNLLNKGFFANYSAAVDPSIMNSFDAAAFRIRHSQIQNTFERFDKNQRRLNPVPMKAFYDPSPVYDEANGGIDAIIRGLVRQPAQTVDRFFSKAVQENMKLLNGEVVDLPAMDIQRGRERGLPGYNTFRKACGLNAAAKFDDFKNKVDPESLAKLAKLYKHPDDVDLYVGGILEAHLDGSSMGPTFSCIIAQQFHNLRFGDRFWYERDDPNVGFTAEQLTELRKATLALVICDNSDRIVKIPKRVLAVNSELVDCGDLPVINLRMWKERP